MKTSVNIGEYTTVEEDLDHMTGPFKDNSPVAVCPDESLDRARQIQKWIDDIKAEPHVFAEYNLLPDWEIRIWAAAIEVMCKLTLDAARYEVHSYLRDTLGVRD